MLRASAFVPVWEQHHQAALVAPLVFARCNVLIDDHLGIVHEVAELCLPDDEISPALQRISVFEADHGLFGQRRLENREVSLRIRDVAQRDVKALPVGTGVLIVPDVVAVKKAPAPDVQAGQPNIESVRQARCVGEILGQTPVDRPIDVAGHGAPVFDHLPDAGVQRETRRYGREPAQDRLQLT